MTLYYKLRTIYLSYYLLAIASSIILISVLGSINILYINMDGNDGIVILEMALFDAASIGFLFTVIAQRKPTYVFSFFVLRTLFQIIFMIFKISLNF